MGERTQSQFYAVIAKPECINSTEKMLKSVARLILVLWIAENKYTALVKIEKNNFSGHSLGRYFNAGDMSPR